jgi:two-component system alkaline phosphatase synthesis response regulator PhoP
MESRAVDRPDDELRFGGFTLEPRLRLLRYYGAHVYLRPREFDLLVALVDDAYNTLSRDEIIFRLRPDGAVTDAALAQHVHRLRVTLARYDPMAAAYVRTIPGVGYRFVGPLQRWPLSANVCPTCGTRR